MKRRRKKQGRKVRKAMIRVLTLAEKLIDAMIEEIEGPFAHPAGRSSPARKRRIKP